LNYETVLAYSDAEETHISLKLTKSMKQTVWNCSLELWRCAHWSSKRVSWRRAHLLHGWLTAVPPAPLRVFQWVRRWLQILTYLFTYLRTSMI